MDDHPEGTPGFTSRKAAWVRAAFAALHRLLFWFKHIARQFPFTIVNNPNGKGVRGTKGKAIPYPEMPLEDSHGPRCGEEGVRNTGRIGFAEPWESQIL